MDPRRPSEAAKQIARTAATVFGGTPRVQRYYDGPEETWVDVLSCSDRPTAGWTTFSTLGLHNYRNELDGSDIRVELSGVAASSTDRFLHALGDMALRVIKDHWLAAPGVVFPGIARDAGLSEALPHLFLAPPFPWPELGTVQVDGLPNVHWLLAVPISDAEHAWLLERGYFEFEKLLDDRGVEYFDLQRPSVV